jgi:hypothetical protein
VKTPFFNIESFKSRTVYNESRGIQIKQISVRVTRDLEPKVKAVNEFYGINGDSASAKGRQLYMLLYEKLLLYKKSQAVGKPTSESVTPMECNIRIEVDGSYYCVSRPPKAVKLLSLRICEVCKAVRYNLPTKTRLEENVCERESESAQPQPKPQEPRGWRAGLAKDWEKNFGLTRADGSMYCPFKDRFRYKHECQECKRLIPERYDFCQQLYREQSLKR